LSFIVQVRRAAELDVAAAQVWYETQRSGLGAEFQFEISNVVARLADNPLIYTAAYRDVRRAVVHRFPYLIWYRVLDDKVTVLACTHSRLNPAAAINRFRS
jgi:plasmid stabilization system protein ParE